MKGFYVSNQSISNKCHTYTCKAHASTIIEYKNIKEVRASNEIFKLENLLNFKKYNGFP